MALKRWPFIRQSAKAERSEQDVAEELGVSKFLVKRGDIKLGQRVGSGAFGAVYTCTVQDRAETMVAKCINVKMMRKEDADLFQMELKIWSRLDHPSCVKFKGVCLGTDEHILLCTYCTGGSLADRHDHCLRTRAAPITSATFAKMALAVADAMAYLHSKKIMHRDLKSHNVLIMASGDLQVADFGLAKFATGEKAQLTAETGSYRWMAPEVLRHEPYDQKCDVYSFAMLCWEMLTYRMPFEQHQPVQAAFAMCLEHKRPEIPPSCHATARELIQRSWDERSEARPTFDKLCHELRKLQQSLLELDSPAAGAPAAGGSPSPPARDGAEREAADMPPPPAVDRTADAGGSRENHGCPNRDSSISGKRELAHRSEGKELKRPKSYNSQLSELRMA